MSKIAITIEGISKRYVLGHQQMGSDGLRHSLEQFVRNPISWARARKRQRLLNQEDFWALRDVSFEVRQGDTVALIGRNGAGKSTLLKILSRITYPTTGHIHLNGRVASLLEVGTGFHQDLTGRENIYLNGAILGMRKSEIRRKFDEIVAFSEIEQFLDTPVKRYSSGMYVRLAFAVAAHLDPEILIVDEVLAVGDAAFQKKCLGRMSQACADGRTVLFVSHNMAAVQSLCSRAVYLQNGRVIANGPVGAVVNQYLQQVTQTRKGLASVIPIGDSLQLTTLHTAPDPITSGGKAAFSLTLRATKPTVLSELSLLIYASHASRAAIIDYRPFGLPLTFSAGQSRRIDAVVAPFPLVEGHYSVGVFARTSSYTGDTFDVAEFSVRARPSNHGFAPYPLEYRGYVELDVSASVTDVNPPSPKARGFDDPVSALSNA